MERLVLREILEGADGVRAEPGEVPAFAVSEAVAATVFAGGQPELLTVARVVRLVLAAGHVGLTTGKGERFFFAYDAIAGLKLEPGDERRIDRGAGFR